MSHAGSSLYEEVFKEEGSGPVLIVCGTGNNGGDGLVCANLLHRSGRFDVTVLLAGDPSKLRTELARRAFSELDPGVKVLDTSGPLGLKGTKAALVGRKAIIDAVLGSGAKGELKGDIAALVEMMNGLKGKKVAVDIPTGLGTGTCFKADLTVTFHDAKEGMFKDGVWDPFCGRVVVRDIGIPEDASLLVGPGDLLRLPTKGPNSKKGETGRLLIVGGGPYTGAPALAAMAALRTGCDLVRVAVPSGIHGVIATMSPDLIVERLPTHDPYSLGPEVLGHLKTLIDGSHSVLLGPGAGDERGSLHLLADLARYASGKDIPLVIDADGLTAVRRHFAKGPFPGSSDVVLTPHRGELRALVKDLLHGPDQDSLLSPVGPGLARLAWTPAAQRLIGRLAIATRAVVLAKGPADLIVSAGEHSLKDHICLDIGGELTIGRTNITGVPEMSVGGTGDILAGLCSGLMACGMPGFDAACISAYVNGRAGEAARSVLGRSLSASSLLGHLRFSP
jgi:NAD(P)H-hydrate epimerase